MIGVGIGKLFTYGMMLPLALALLASFISAVKGAWAARRDEKKKRLMPVHW